MHAYLTTQEARAAPASSLSTADETFPLLFLRADVFPGEEVPFRVLPELGSFLRSQALVCIMAPSSQCVGYIGSITPAAEVEDFVDLVVVALQIVRVTSIAETDDGHHVAQAVVRNDAEPPLRSRMLRDALLAFPPWAVALHDTVALCRDIGRQLSAPPGKTPEQLSWLWGASVCLDDGMRSAFVRLRGTSARLRFVRRQLTAAAAAAAALSCRRCGAAVSSAAEVLPQEASHYVNPHGHHHQLLLVRHAGPLVDHGDPTLEHTYFPGYAWSNVDCAACHNHLGWRFQRDEDVFFGLRKDAAQIQSSDEG